MRKLAFLVLAISLALCGCSDARRGEEMMKDFSEKTALADSIELQAEISADISGKDFDFTVLYTRNSEEECVKILAPENIAGVAAVIRDGGASLHYEDLILAVGSISRSISPMSAVPLAINAVAHGNFSGVRTENCGEAQMTAADFFVSETLSTTVYLDGQSIPQFITLSENGKTVAECKILSFCIGSE